jgi:hypothetical protein
MLVFLALLAPSSQASEPKSRIRYAEPARITASQLPSSSKVAQSGVPTRLVFDAYGRRFDLELESNDRLLRRLSATRRGELPPHDLYRGRVTGLAGSWVRLTRLPDGLYGAIWDGSEFYSIAPAHALAEFMGGATPRTSDQPLVYRAADVDVLTGPGFCAAIERDGSAVGPITGSDHYKALLQELRQASAAVIATRELDVAMIGDFEFFSQEADPLGELLSRLNVVDGIFTEQVGVVIAASELKVFDSSADPFTTSNPQTLLDEVGSYRVATPAIAATGLAHLVTGRDLTGSTVGIAYIAGVCEAQFGVSLSERFTDPFFSALIAAHEFGHNFGAPHDAESGSPCQNTGSGFLMEPTLNGSSTFSQCSLDRMAPVMAASSCIKTRQYVDLAVEMQQTAYTVHMRVPEIVQFEVVNRGTKTAAGGTVSVDFLHLASPASVTVEGGSCTVEFEDITCQLGSIPPGARRRVRFELTATSLGNTSADVSVATEGDADSDNNHGALTVAFVPSTDAAIAAETPRDVTVLSGDEFEISYRVRVNGIAALDAATTRTSASNFVILSATPESGSCSVTSSTAICALGSIAVGASRRVTLRIQAGRAGDREIHHQLEGSVDDTTDNNFAIHNVWVNPLVDLVVETDSTKVLAQRGETFTSRFVVRSIGPREARSASISVHWPSEFLEVRSISAQDATCTADPVSPFYFCRFAAAIGSGQSREVSVEFRAHGVGSGSIEASVFSPDNQHFGGPLSTRVTVQVEARESADVRLEPSFDNSHYEARPFFVHWRVGSKGLTAAQAVTVTLNLPSGITALSAETTIGSCTLAASSVRCELGTLNPDSAATVVFRVQGDHSGEFDLTAEAAASNDADPTNNVDTARMTLLPNIDVRVETPPRLERIKIGTRVRYPVTVRTSVQPVSNVRLRITGWNLDVEVISISLGSCAPVPDAIECVLGELPGNATVELELELLGLEPGSGEVRVEARGDMDNDIGNDWGGELLSVVPPGNARIEMSSASRMATVGETFVSPAITVRALAPTEAVRLQIVVPPGLTVESVEQHSGPCSIDNGMIDCELGDLQLGEQRSTSMSLRAVETGAYTITASVVTHDDIDDSDNTASVTIDVDAAGQQPEPPSSTGGGGGGALDWSSLGLVLLALGLRRRPPGTVTLLRRQVHSGRCSDGRGPAH